MRALFLLALIVFLCGGCAEFRRAFSRPYQKVEPKKERKETNTRSPYRHPMDEWIFGNKKQRQDFAGAGLSETERKEWEKFRKTSGSDAFYDREINAAHQSMYERKRANEQWVYSPRPTSQDETRDH